MKKILYLGTNDVNFLVFKKTVEEKLSFDIEVKRITDFKQGEKELEREKYDLIISGIKQFPGKKIIENLRAGKYGATNIKTTAIAYTAFCYPEAQSECLEIGFDSYISRPDYDNVLKKKIENLI